jgi:hypothetical protein
VNIRDARFTRERQRWLQRRGSRLIVNGQKRGIGNSRFVEVRENTENLARSQRQGLRESRLIGVYERKMASAASRRPIWLGVRQGSVVVANGRRSGPARGSKPLDPRPSDRSRQRVMQPPRCGGSRRRPRRGVGRGGALDSSRRGGLSGARGRVLGGLAEVAVEAITHLRGEPVALGAIALSPLAHQWPRDPGDRVRRRP